MKYLAPFVALAAAIALAAPAAAGASDSPVATPPPLRLYTLDCGRLDIGDMGMFSDTGEHAGERGVMAVPCYLIRDGDRWLLWDTGLGDAIAATPAGIDRLGGHWTVRRTLRDQLAAIGLTPADIAFVALSHLHADHSGNIGLFRHATLLIGAPELAWAKAGGLGADPALVAAAARMKAIPLGSDHDVFGDGRVRIIATPGHTPGHRALLVRLPRSGAVMLSGDLYHTRENYERSLVPAVNVSRADTLASFDRFRRIVEREKARVIVQHAPEDFARMAAFPGWLD